MHNTGHIFNAFFRQACMRASIFKKDGKGNPYVLATEDTNGIDC